jgi:hypothetical protein
VAGGAIVPAAAGGDPVPLVAAPAARAAAAAAAAADSVTETKTKTEQQHLHPYLEAAGPARPSRRAVAAEVVIRRCRL